MNVESKDCSLRQTHKHLHLKAGDLNRELSSQWHISTSSAGRYDGLEERCSLRSFQFVGRKPKVDGYFDQRHPKISNSLSGQQNHRVLGIYCCGSSQQESIEPAAHM